MAQVARPKTISVISVIAIILILLAFPMLFMPSVKHMGDFVPMVLGIIITMQFVSVIGVWHMKRWGVILFIIMFTVRVVTFMYLDMLGFRFYFNVFYSLIFMVIFLRFFKRMDKYL
jgi:hypothetical protein